MDIKINPKKLSGYYYPPSSKSIGHRAIICASLSDGVSEISNVDFSDDIDATIDAMIEFGAKIERFKRKVVIEGIFYREKSARTLDRTEAIVDDTQEKIYSIFCGESGSTLRFLMPISLLFGKKTEFITHGNLINRPMDVYFNIFKDEGIEFKIDNNSIIIGENKGLKNRKLYIDGGVSSQFISGLLFYLPLLDFDTEIEVFGELQSKAYVDLTIDTLEKFGVGIENEGHRIFRISGNQSYKPSQLAIEPDFSQIAFFAVANELDSHVKIDGIDVPSNQGDRAILGIIKDFKVLDDNMIFSDIIDNTFVLDGSQIPDIIPILALLFSKSNIRCRVENLDRLKIKESDRLESTVEELKKLGYDIEIGIFGDRFCMEINYRSLSRKDNGKMDDDLIQVSSHNDHRIAMMLAIAATVHHCPVIIKNAQCVSKSYPYFWKDYKMLGGDISECDLGEKL
ncbi:3-phosphoshikimate 1-carboxyvinyltransferase [Peptostreptococcus porci]|uniref:3-phosphoshikimate 1-carboxyvinyltransferase n=1 Tax=Peptostreptococcus porci TaxID=2652282 RepID=UPI002A90C65E|nr:3-phosphoshikimate 1-carboxyvinyltransferase [Peptostreptococcus porci]MDY6232054.1 3-phosphoshikimate 1-carboxyvinyltransferase [Peptostreptococcus porci]